MAFIAIDHEDWRAAYLWLVLCFLIDSLDGTLARRFNVEEVLPFMDGKTIDFVIDFVAYAIVPAFFFYKASMVAPDMMNISLAVILLSSALYYGKKGMVEDGQYFVGFPVLWNFVVFYQFFIFHNNQLLNLLTVFLFGILHFVPLRFAYPSRSRSFFWSHLVVSVIGLTGAVLVLWSYPEPSPVFTTMAIVGAVYFLVFAVYDTYSR